MKTACLGRFATTLITCIGVLAAPAFADHVDPVFVAGNPDCEDVGHGFGFKINGSANGTYTLTSVDGELTGGAAEDPNNSVTISNSDGTFFDWSATLGIDAVIVKGGPNANLYDYDPEAFSDQGLHAPLNGDQPFGLSHLEFCYDYDVDVSKTADTTFTRTWRWNIGKSVSPASWSLFTGDSGTSKYTVSVDKVDFVDSDWAVTGTINVENNTPFDAEISGVSDTISPDIDVTPDCGVTFPHTLASGDTLSCTYSASLPDGDTRTNTATVTTSGAVGGGEATADVIFDTPTTVVNGSINVVDTNGMSWGPVSDDTTWMYEITFTCDADEGSHTNTATIVETGQSDDAMVSVTCYGLTVTKNASTTFDRDWDWDVTKSVDSSALTLSPGQTFVVNYTVNLSATAVDSNWAVSGDIWVANPAPMNATLTGVSDSVGGVAATVDCPSLTVPANGSLHCTYSADLPDDSNRTNTATATLQNVSIASDGTVTTAGTTDFAGTAPVTFGDPTNEADECGELTDSLEGSLGSFCASDAPVTVTYSHEIGPFSEPDDCGTQEVVNTATFTTDDTSTTTEDSQTVTVEVVCGVGCTLTPGYWKTHSEHGPAPFDDTWNELPDGANTTFFLSGQTYFEALWTSPRGNAYYILAHAYIATELNILNGASVPTEVADAFIEATGLFETWTPEQIGDLKGNQNPRPRFLELAGILDMYNNGILGPGHCSEDSTSAD